MILIIKYKSSVNRSFTVQIKNEQMNESKK